MILDSNIVIGYLNGDESIRDGLHVWRESGRVFFISHISIIEALSLSTLTSAQIGDIKNFLGDFVVIPLDMQVSLAAAESRRIHNLSLADSIIAAAARVNNLPLVTRDKKLRSLSGIAFADI